MKTRNLTYQQILKIINARKFLILIGLLLALVALESLVLLKLNPPLNKTLHNSQNLQKLADQIRLKCSNTEYPPNCYDKAIPLLLDKPDNLTMEQVFQVTTLIQEADKSYPYCHVLGHSLSAKEVKKDPSKWKEVLARCPSGVCSNGCIHGGFQEKFRTEYLSTEELEKIKPELEILCEKKGSWNPTQLEQASCYHALGHLMMYITNADTDKSVELCRELAIKDDGRDLSEVCFDGVFMQIFQPLEAEDIALVAKIKVDKDQITSFCSEYEEIAQSSCLSESWPLFLEQIKDPNRLVEFCSKDHSARQARCYSSIFYVLVAQFKFDIEKIKDYCSNLPEKLSGMCFANSASRLIETDYRNTEKAIEFCGSVPYYKSKEACYNELVFYAGFNFHPNSKEFNNLCSHLPKEYQERCYNQDDLK